MSIFEPSQIAMISMGTLTFIKPAKLGDKLSACAEEISLVKRNGIYDVTVKNQNGHLIAEFRGCSRTVNGQIF